MYEKKFNSSRTPLRKEKSVYNRMCVQVVDWVVEKMHNASAAIKNNDSKNGGALYKHTELMYLYISVLVIAGRNAGGVIYTTMKNVQECVAGTADVCYTVNLLFGVSHYIAQLVDIYLYVYANWTIKEKKINVGI